MSKLDEVNIWIEHLWRTLKREYVYLNSVETVSQMRCEIAKYIDYYHAERPYQGIGGRTQLGFYQEGIINNIKNSWQKVA